MELFDEESRQRKRHGMIERLLTLRLLQRVAKDAEGKLEDRVFNRFEVFVFPLKLTKNPTIQYELIRSGDENKVPVLYSRSKRRTPSMNPVFDERFHAALLGEQAQRTKRFLGNRLQPLSLVSLLVSADIPGTGSWPT